MFKIWSSLVYLGNLAISPYPPHFFNGVYEPMMISVSTFEIVAVAGPVVVISKILLRGSSKPQEWRW